MGPTAHPPTEFDQAEAEYARLKQLVFAGRMTTQQFDAELLHTMIEYQGRFWMIGANTGRWYVHSGTGWTEATPPTSREPTRPRPTGSAPARRADENRADQTRCTVVLHDIGPNKITVVTVIRELTGLSLKDAKDLVEALPATIKQGMTPGEAAPLAADLTATGAHVSIIDEQTNHPPQPTARAEQAWRPTHSVPAGGLPAWAAPNPADHPVTRIDAGVELQVLQRSGQWAYIACSNGWTAWVSGGSIEPLPDPTATHLTQPTAPAAAWRPTHLVPDGGMPAWAQPDATRAPIAHIDAGVALQVLKRSGAWAHIICDNGWSAWVDGGAMK